MDESDKWQPTLPEALLPVLFLVIALSSSVYLFGEDSSYGPNQIALFAASGLTLILAWRRGFKWAELERAMAESVGSTVNAILILLVVGALIGSWILSGTVPAMIYYGLLLIDPSAFYITACVVCALSSLAIGSSWSTIGTVGLALVGMASALGLPLGITVGAIVSGAYFGDKMSPLSDTTNLAPAIAGGDLFTHIRHMMWTTFPAIAIAMTVYGLLGLGIEGRGDDQRLAAMLPVLKTQFSIGPHLLLPVCVTVFLAIRKVPALPAMMLTTVTGILFAFLFQREVMAAFAGGDGFGALVTAQWTVLFAGFEAQTGDQVLNELLSRGGMSGMLTTVWLVISAVTFGALLERLGLLQRLVAGILASARSSGGLIVATVLSCIGTNIVAADQYISIVVPGRAYRLEFRRRGLAPENLSRALEDAGTVTSPLVPWNTCGAFIFGVVGVSAFVYAPYCFFNLISPVLSAIYGVVNFKIVRLPAPASQAAG